MKQKLLLIAALFFGILAFLLSYYQIKYEKEKIRGLAKSTIVVKMKRDMVEGETLKESDIEQERVLRQASVKTKEIEWGQKYIAVGKKLSRSVKKGEIITFYDLQIEQGTGREGLAGIIRMGQRAISISVDTTASVSGLVRPNHHVDIIGTFKFPEMRGDKALDTITLTLLQNVVVLATGADMAKAGTDNTGKSYSTVTLALTPEEAELIVFASQKGRLTLSLRNVEDTQILTNLESVNFKYLEENVNRFNIKRDKMMKEGRGE